MLPGDLRTLSGPQALPGDPSHQHHLDEDQHQQHDSLHQGALRVANSAQLHEGSMLLSALECHLVQLRFLVCHLVQLLNLACHLVGLLFLARHLVSNLNRISSHTIVLCHFHE